MNKVGSRKETQRIDFLRRPMLFADVQSDINLSSVMILRFKYKIYDQLESIK